MYSIPFYSVDPRIYEECFPSKYVLEFPVITLRYGWQSTHARCEPVYTGKSQPPLQTHLIVLKIGLRVFKMPSPIENTADREIRCVICLPNIKGVRVYS